MEIEALDVEHSLVAGAIAIGAVCAIAATLVLFPIIDRHLRARLKLERGGAMFLLLGLAILAGVGAGVAGYFWLEERHRPTEPASPPVQVEEATQSSAH